MSAPSSPVLVVLADDLSGAAETATLLRTSTHPVRVVLAGDRGYLPQTTGGAVTVLDLDIRHAGPEGTAARVRAAVATHPAAPVLVKVDSLLRGPLADVLGAVGPVVVATALPALDRVVRAGVLTVSGASLAQTTAWATEGRPAPESVPAALAPLPTELIDLATVRSESLTDALRRILDAGRVPVCDGETDADLDMVAAAVSSLDGVALAGSGGLAAAVGRRLGPPIGPAGQGARTGTAGPLVVVGTAEKVAAEQVRRLRATGVPELLVPLPVLASAAPEPGWTERIAAALARGPLVLRPDPDADVEPGISRGLSAGLGRLVAAALAQVEPAPAEPARIEPAPVETDPVEPAELRVGLALTGGETARRVLDALGVRTLAPRSVVHHGAVVSTADDGRTVVTRPGSFGGPGSLIEILTALSAPPSDRAGPPARSGPSSRSVSPTHSAASGGTTEGTTMTTTATPADDTLDAGLTPLIAVTMGDGAGVGPEVVVGALVDPEIGTLCRPVVIGDAGRLRAAAEVLGLSPEIAVITEVSQAVFTPGRINVIDLGLLPADLPWGRRSPVAGHAAYEYVRVAAELAMAGAVQGICTAPLNKEALHSAGHIYPGHTELLAHFCGIDEVSMMLSSPKIRVIHVTTHIGLIDAVAKIEPGLVERTVRRGHDALVRAGIPAPRIGVCGINPHAGEGGLFGYGEEEEKIVPAIERLQADGIDARGPLPADTAFFVAGRGDYDLIVAMYHDQGHGPVKILGIESGVNITVGLPVIRTSVDHGTAFDIAGTGKVEVGSMIEALRQAAQMSPRPTA